MRIGELMITDLKTIDPSATVADAAASLTENHVSALPVVDAHGRIVGVLSTSDILQAAAEAADAEERDRVFEETIVRDLMTVRPATIGMDGDVKEAAQQMLYLEVHRLFVVDGERLVGVLSQSDIVRAVATAKL